MGPTPIRFGDAALAQLVEHRIRNAGVRGSNPLSGTITLALVKSRLLLNVPKYGRSRGYGVGGALGNLRGRTVHSGQRADGDGDDAGGLRPCECRGLSVLQLWGLEFASTIDECFLLKRSVV